MCVFRPPQPEVVSAAPPPVQPRQDTDTSLPTSKEVVNPDDSKAEVEYGAGKKQQSPGAGKKRGSAQLKIPLNTGGGVGEKSGGANV